MSPTLPDIAKRAWCRLGHAGLLGIAFCWLGCVPNERPDEQAEAADRQGSVRTGKTQNTAVFRRDAGKPEGAYAPPSNNLRAADGDHQATSEGTRPDFNATMAADSADEASDIKKVFIDRFERTRLGADYLATSPNWQLEDGRLCGKDALNRPVWLRRRLPMNARIEFDAVSRSSDGDIKVEVWGDGKGYAKSTSYDHASSYVLIFGGWKNQLHVLARLDEHGDDRLERKVDPTGSSLKALPVVPNQTYHFKIERSDGKTLRWFIDDIEIHAFVDEQPLFGKGHQFLGFNDWRAEVCFDNLQIVSLQD